MGLKISRRLFLAFAGGAIVLPRIVMGEESVPTLLDHILLGCDDLQRGIDFVEERAGVRAAFGGVHPGRGTQNALLSLGERRYLEIIAPDPKQNGPTSHPQLATMTEPRLIGWAAHPGDLGTFAKKLSDAGVAFEGPTPGSRKRPDGGVLSWKTLTLKDDRAGLLPFFIEWSADSKHPSEDAPHGCRLEHFALAGPDPDGLSKDIQRIGIDAPIQRGQKVELLARINGLRSGVDLSS